MKTASKRWKPVVAALALIAAAVWGVSHRLAAEKPLPDLTAVRRGDVERAVLATGRLRPARLVAVGAQVTGRVLSLKAQPGQAVRAGDVIALIDATSQRNQLDKARAALRRDEALRDQRRAALDLARLELARNRAMLGGRAVARAELDKAESAMRARQAELAQSEAEIAVSQVGVRIAETDLARTRVTAPADGTVLATVVQEGQNVNAEQSVPTIAILGQLDTMTVEADISEADVTRMRPGLPLYFTLPGRADERRAARLETIAPAPDAIAHDKALAPAAANGPTASAVYYKGLFHTPNPDGALKTYMTAEVHIVLETARGVLLVPASALKETGRDKAVARVFSGGAVRERAVETGVSDRIVTEIRAGLKEGDRVLSDYAAAPGTAS